jgi:UPF0755 protein
VVQNAGNVKLLLRLFRLGCLAFLIGAGFAFYFLHTALTPADPEGISKPLVVEIPEGASAAGIAQSLETNGLIRSALAFRILVRFGGQDGAIRAGHYTLSASENPVKILDHLVKGDTMQRRVTLPEGLTLVEVAGILEKNEVCPAQDFLEMARTRGKDFGPGFPENLEGYLFPDTYDLPWKCSTSEVLGILTSRFDEIFTPLWSEKAPLGRAETVVLASLVEREAQVQSERAVIAGVYLNRLAEGMLLQCDATVQYALGRQKSVLMHQDLKIDSPYNTYRHPGLPPGPICNPGRAALEAAVRPQRTEYLFYVRNDVKGDGSHVFSRNYTEHEKSIDRYQR